MVTALLVLSVVVLTAAGGVYATPVAIHHVRQRRHNASLARIAVLERELGVGWAAIPTPPAKADFTSALSLALTPRPAPPPPYAGPRTVVFCPECRRDVVREAGRCQVSSRSACAKLTYLRPTTGLSRSKPL